MRTSLGETLEKVCSKEEYERYSRELSASYSFRTLISNVHVPMEGLKNYEEWISLNNLGERVR